MADEADRAQVEIEREIERASMMRNTVKRYSVDCVECGEYIPQARQQATGGTDKCIECAE